MTPRPDTEATHDEIEPLLAQHALGSLTGDLAQRADAHLDACAGCRRTFDELAAAVAEVELAAAPANAVDPAPDATIALLRAARSTQQESVAGPVPQRVRAARPRRRWLGVAGLGVGAASAVAASVMYVSLTGTVDRRDSKIESLERRLSDARGDQVAVLRGASIKNLDTAGPFGDARAQVVLQKDAGIVAFRKVPAPPEGMVWQVWVVDADERISSVGVIDAARQAAFLSIDDVDPDDIERFIVTVEPAGGSDEPSAEEVVTGTV